MKKLGLWMLAGWMLITVGCGSGGGGGSASGAPSGPPNPWATPKALDTILVASYAGTTLTSATPDQVGNAYLFGVNDGEGSLSLVDTAGTILPNWPVVTSSLGGNTVVPIKATGDAANVAMLFKRLPLNDWYVIVYDTAFVRPPTANIAFAQNALGTDAVIDGNKVYYARVSQGGSEATMIFVYDFIAAGPVVEFTPPIAPRKLLVSGTELIFVDNDRVYSYNKDLNLDSMTWTANWNPAPDARVDALAVANGNVYLIGRANGHLAIAAHDATTGALVFSNEYLNIPLGASDVGRIAASAAGEIYFTALGKLGRIDKTSGTLLTANPLQVRDASFTIIGTEARFVYGSNLERVDISGL